MAFPADYLAAVEKLATGFSEYNALTGGHAILVGGAAVALHTKGSFQSNDFDVVAADDAFSAAMEEAGFVRDLSSGHGLGGWYHPDTPNYGVEQVSGGYFEGRADRDRCIRLTVREGEIVIPPIEDMIADRLGQHEVSKGDLAMLRQAQFLYGISTGLDHKYLTRRIEEEGGNPALLELYDPHGHDEP